jgi:molecular chaperone HtpG
MEERKFSVDLGGMISILSDHLYSSPDVFLRELLQNAADAVSMRKDADDTR